MGSIRYFEMVSLPQSGNAFVQTQLVANIVGHLRARNSGRNLQMASQSLALDAEMCPFRVNGSTEQRIEFGGRNFVNSRDSTKVASLHFKHK